MSAIKTGSEVNGGVKITTIEWKRIFFWAWVMNLNLTVQTHECSNNFEADTNMSSWMAQRCVCDHFEHFGGRWRKFSRMITWVDKLWIGLDRLGGFAKWWMFFAHCKPTKTVEWPCCPLFSCFFLWTIVKRKRLLSVLPVFPRGMKQWKCLNAHFGFGIAWRTIKGHGCTYCWSGSESDYWMVWYPTNSTCNCNCNQQSVIALAIHHFE